MPSLLIDIGANIARLQQDMAKAQTTITGFTRQVEKDLSGLKYMMGTVGIGVSFAGIIAAGKEFAVLGAKARQAEESFQLVAKASGESVEKILAGMKRASAGTVDESDAMQKAVKGMALGLTGNEMVRIMETARVSARIAGEDVKVAYENITEAIATGMPKALKRYGLISKEEMTIVNQALEAGVQGVSLYDIAMSNAAIQVGKMGDMHSNAAEKIQAFKARIEDAKESVGVWLIDLPAAMARASAAMSAAEAGIVAPADDAARIFFGGSPDELEQGRSMALERKNAMIADIKARTDAMIAGKKAEKEAIEAARKAAEEAKKNYQEGAELVARLQEGTNRQNEENQRWFDSQAAAREKDYIDGAELINRLQAQTDEETARNMKWIDDESKVRAAAATQRLQAERDMFQDMRGFEQNYYTAVKLMIDSQTQKYRDLGIDEATIEKWAQGEKLKAFDAYVDKAGTLYERLEKRTRKYKEEAGDIHEALFKAIDAGAKNLESQMSNNFFDVLTGNMQRVSLDWDSMWGAMARSAANSMAKMATTKFINPALNAGMGFLGSAAGSGLAWLSDYVGGFSNVLDWIGLSAGEYLVEKDKLAMLHEGEMVLPEGYAQMLRDLMESSGGYAGPQSSFAMEPTSVVGPAVSALMNDTLAEAMSRGAMLGALSGFMAAGPMGIAPGAMIGMGRGMVTGIGRSGFHAMGLTDLGYIAGIQDAYGMDPNTGLNAAGANISAGMGGFGEVGGFSGVNDSEIGGEWREGGISRGSERGHLETLHGTEAIIPLPDGRTVPVSMKDGGGDIHIHLDLDGREIASYIYKTSRSGLKIMHSNGITDI